MKKLFFLLIAFSVSNLLAGQTKVLIKHQKPENATKIAPVTHDLNAGTISPPGTNSPYSPPSSKKGPSSRRDAAIAKVQGRTPMVSAKGLGPAMYSTDADLEPVTYSTTPIPATTMTVNGENVQRDVRKGFGQVGDDLFTPVSELHYVQFAVYCKNTPVDKSPTIDGLYLIWHPGSICPGGEPGASYIVKGYTSPELAKSAVLDFKAQGIDCWYNPALTGAEVEIIGVH